MIEKILIDEAYRRQQFPITAKKIFLGHAGVTTIPRCVADAVIEYTQACCENSQEFGGVLQRVDKTRKICADFIGADANEIALLGPTSLGLSLFANGLDWKSGDEVVCYADDYPANVYPWMALEKYGVTVRKLHPKVPGEITPELVAASLTPRTRLVALASCHFLTGYRIDIDAIGALVHAHGALFALDAIQTIGAFPTRVTHVDFLSADAHKWMLGPLAVGIVYVKKEHFEKLRPTLIGAWNVHSPNFIPQDEIRFFDTAQRYEPGVLNVAGIFGMQAALEMLNSIGIEKIAERILRLKTYLVENLEELGCTILPPVSGHHASGITTFYHPKIATATIAKEMAAKDIEVSHRHDRQGNGYIRASHHFYNTEAEIDAVIAVLSALL